MSNKLNEDNESENASAEKFAWLESLQEKRKWVKTYSLNIKNSEK